MTTRAHMGGTELEANTAEKVVHLQGMLNIDARALGGLYEKTGLTGGTVDLSTLESSYGELKLSGTLTSNLIVRMAVTPDANGSTPRMFIVWNNLTMGAFSVNVTTANAGASVALSAGQKILLAHDGTNVFNPAISASVALSDGDKGDISVGGGGVTWTIDPNVVTYAKMQDVSAASRILGRKTAGAGDPEECTLSEVLDFIGSAAQGDILYRAASAWARLAAGTNGQFLKTQGAGANPAWATVSAGFTGIVARATRNTAQSIANSANVALQWNVETIDSDNILDLGTSPTRFTVKTAGDYILHGMIPFDINSTGFRQVALYVNGALAEYGPCVNATGGGVYTGVPFAFTARSLIVNDYLEIYVVQNSGGALNAASAGGVWPYASMERVR